MSTSHQLQGSVQCEASRGWNHVKVLEHVKTLQCVCSHQDKGLQSSRNTAPLALLLEIRLKSYLRSHFLNYLKEYFNLQGHLQKHKCQYFTVRVTGKGNERPGHGYHEELQVCNLFSTVLQVCTF